MYFSPTDTTKKIVSSLSCKIAEKAGKVKPDKTFDFTLPDARNEILSFTPDDFVVIGVPVYAGRVPNVLLDYLNSISGNNAVAIAVVLYGNRSYDDALIELTDILKKNGFIVAAAGAFIGQHSFSDKLGKNRPDKSDMDLVNNFADRIYSKMCLEKALESVNVKGHKPYRPYYIVKNEDNKPVYDFRKIKPKTNKDCTDCKLCVNLCPMGSIDFDDVSLINGICIKCCACIKKCPFDAKFFDDPDFIMHKEDLEQTYKERKEPEFFI